MAIKTDPDQIEQLRGQLAEANRQSHFVIFESAEKASGETQLFITDYASYRQIKEIHDEKAQLHIIQDIVPITDNLVKWAIAESNVARQAGDQQVLADLEYYTNSVLVENNLPANSPEPD